MSVSCRDIVPREDGFAGVQPVERLSWTVVVPWVEAHPLLCTVSCASNTASLPTIFGDSLIISRIGIESLFSVDWIVLFCFDVG